jgi:hypothetical protein
MNDSCIFCTECGFEFEDLTLWKVEGSTPTKCPTCRVTTSTTYPPYLESTSTPSTIEPVPGTATNSDEPLSPTELLLRSQRHAFWVVSFVASLFVVACGLPAVSIWEELPPRTGFWLLVLGFGSCVPWLPNPLLLYGSISLVRGRNRTALIAGLAACVCSVPVVMYTLVGGGFQRMHSGYFLWQADIFIFSAAAFGMTKKFGEKPGLVENEVSNSQVSE